MSIHWQKFRLGAVLIFVILLAACQPDSLPPTFTPVVMETVTAVSTLPPTRTPTAISPEIPIPLAAEMSNDVEGWFLHENETHAYRISYPPAAAITLYSDDCLRADLYDSGFLLITAVAVPNLPPACLPPQSTAAAQPEMIHLAGEPIMADKQDGPLYRAVLPSGLQIDFGLLPNTDPDHVDSQAALAVIGEMVDSIRFANDVMLVQVTPTPIPTACLDDSAAAYTTPTGNLRIVYELDGQSWEWREEMGTAVPLPPEPTPEPEPDGVLSPDGRFRAGLRQPDEDTFEIWLSTADGSDSHRLVAISTDELYGRYPQATGVDLAYAWVNESWISYRFLPQFEGIGDPPVQAVGILDAANGDTWTILPPDVAWAYRFVNMGQQLIALTENGIQMINTADGTIRFDVPLDVVVPFEQGITFTPDDSRLFVYTAAGIALINPADGTFVEISMDYEPVGMGHYSILPPQYWLENGTRFYTMTANGDVWANDAEFTIWLVDTAVSTSSSQAVPLATPLNTFTGQYISVELSPDRRWVAFSTQQMNNTRQLYLADVHTGEQFLYDDGRLLEFIGWSQNSSQFLYKPAESVQPILGNICAGPRPLTDIAISLNGNVKWVDDQRLLVLESVPGDGQPLRLVSLDGQSSLIATLQGEYPLFRFYFAE